MTYVKAGMHPALGIASSSTHSMTTVQQTTSAGLVNRVPEVTLVFWILKILATTIGETAGDLLSITIGLGTVVTSYVMGALLLICLGFQFRARRYVPPIY